jgi:hypothetical protein
LSLQVVEKPSSLLEIVEEEQLPVNANHVLMCKFESRDDETYEKVWKRVRRILKSKTSLRTVGSTTIQNRDSTQQNPASANSPPDISYNVNGAQLDRSAGSRSGKASLTSASSFSRDSHATNGAEVDRAVDSRSGNANQTFAKNVTEQVANLSINPKTVRIPLEARKSGQYLTIELLVI